MDPLTFTVIGIALTLLGIIFTSIGSYLQNSKSENLLDSISNLSQANYDLAEEVKQQADTFQTDIMKVTGENADLSKQLLDKSEENFRTLLMPKIDVIKVQLDFSKKEDATFDILVRNSGNDYCYNLALIIDENSSPMVYTKVVNRFLTLPNGVNAEFHHNAFIDRFHEIGATKEVKAEYEEYFRDFVGMKKAIYIKYHFIYEWNGDYYKTPTYSTFLINRDTPITSSEGKLSKIPKDLIDQKTKLPKMNRKTGEYVKY